MEKRTKESDSLLQNEADIQLDNVMNDRFIYEAPTNYGFIFEMLYFIVLFSYETFLVFYGKINQVTITGCSVGKMGNYSLENCLMYFNCSNVEGGISLHWNLFPDPWLYIFPGALLLPVIGFVGIYLKIWLDMSQSHKLLEFRVIVTRNEVYDTMILIVCIVLFLLYDGAKIILLTHLESASSLYTFCNQTQIYFKIEPLKLNFFVLILFLPLFKQLHYRLNYLSSAIQLTSLVGGSEVQISKFWTINSENFEIAVAEYIKLAYPNLSTKEQKKMEYITNLNRKQVAGLVKYLTENHQSVLQKLTSK